MKKAILTEGPVGRTIIRLMLPMMVGMVGMVIFNLVDTFFIGKLGTQALAAMSFTFPVIMVVTSVSMGIGIGASSVISHAIGKGDSEQVKRLTTDSLLLAVTLVTAIVIVGLMTIRPLFRALGAEGETLDLVTEYMVIWYYGMPFVVIPMVGNNAIRAAGNTVIPSLIMVSSIITNVILDPLLIFGIGPFPRWEMEGAAIATVIGRALSLFISLYFLRRRFDMLTSHYPGFAKLMASWKKILYIGLPSALTQLTTPISMGLITRFVAGFGEAAVAAFGVGTRVEMFIMSPVFALAAVLVSFTGQNYGAGKIDRLEEGIRFSHRLSIGLGMFAVLILFLFGRPIAAIFDSNPAVISIAVLYFLIASPGFGFHGVVGITSSAYSALHHPIHALALNVLRMVLLYVPIAYIASRYWGVGGVFSGASISALISGTVGYISIHRTTARLKAVSPESVN